MALDQLFTYRSVQIQHYPSHATVAFHHVRLERQVEVKIGSKVVGLLRKGTPIETVVWMTGKRFEFKLSFGTYVTFAEKQDRYDPLVQAMVTADAAAKTPPTATPN